MANEQGEWGEGGEWGKGGEWGGKKSRDTIPLSSCKGEKAFYNVFYTG